MSIELRPSWWALVLAECQKRGLIQSGLTLPYLAGAYMHLVSNTDANGLLSEVLDSLCDFAGEWACSVLHQVRKHWANRS